MRNVLWIGFVVGGCEAAQETCVDGLDANGDGLCDAAGVDWSATSEVPDGTNRGDLYGYDDPELLEEVRLQGLEAAMVWPVDVSGLLLPYDAITRFFSDADDDPQRAALANLASNVLGFGTMDEMYAWLGLVDFPTEGNEGRYAVPSLELPDGMPMGAGVVDTELGGALTFSCATCHVGELFGRPVVGLTNRRERANDFFHLATLFFPGIDPELFAEVTDATDDELAQFVRTQANLPAVGAKTAEVLGLDTALAQVGLSMVRRQDDPWATRDEALERSPLPTELDTLVADSKPAVWWNLRYKTRWLSDGSIVSGNPVFTNFLWNELGRATDLHELDDWLTDNRATVDALTAAVFATPAPRWTDWFGTEGLDLEAAKRGQELFGDHCASCHGTYTKGWEDGAGAEAAFQNTSLTYFPTTPVLDVGTDPQRAQAMDDFAHKLNALQISKNFGTVVEVQQGYIPTPLDGIWARYPYLHNQSVPTLCDLLSPPEERTEVFWMGPSADPETDFDPDCVGFPTGEAVPEPWKDDPHARFDTSVPGLRNVGHDDMLRDSDGAWRLDVADRADLIAFLKTL